MVSGSVDPDLDDFVDATEIFVEAEDQDEADQTYPLHRAAYYNDGARIRHIAGNLTTDELHAQDPHGNNALHVAALRRATAAASALLAAGLAVDVKSRRGWTALEEALAARDHATAKVLHAASLAAVRASMKAKRRELLAAMRVMPDYSMNLSWRLGSAVPGLGLLLRRYAPADTYTLWKVGDRLRVDGTLMGIDTKSASLIPEWKRGHFTLIMDGSAVDLTTPTGQAATEAAANGAPPAGTEAAARQRGSAEEADSGTFPPAAAAAAEPQEHTPQPLPEEGDAAGANGRPSAAGGSGAPRLLFLHHGKRRWVDLGADKKAMKAEEQAALEEQLLYALERDVDKQRFKARGFTVAPLKGWLGGEVRERVEGWSTRVYEAAGKMVGVSTSKAAWSMPETATFEDYLAASPPPDDVSEVVFDPLNPTTYDPMRAHKARQKGWGQGDNGEEYDEGDALGWEDPEGGSMGGLAAAAAAKGKREGSGWWGSGGGGSAGGRSKPAGRSGGGWWGSGGGAAQEGGEDSAGDQLVSDGSNGGGRASGGDADADDADDSAATGSDGVERVPLFDADGDGASGSSGSALEAAGAATTARRDKPPATASTAATERHEPTSSGGKGAGAQLGKKPLVAASGGRQLRARLWMAEGFPMRLSALVPLLEVIGSANKQIGKVARFMAKYSTLDLFPVKIQVPLLLTVYAVVGFAQFKELGPADAPPPDFFEVPEGYSRRLLNEMLDKHTGGMIGTGGRKQGDDGMFGELEDELDWG